MPVTGIRWLPTTGDDIHLLRGNKSQRLDEILVLELSDDSAVLANSPPSGVSVEFKANFAGAPDNHGVEVNTVTGEVEAKAINPERPLLRNFLIHAVVTDLSATQPIKPVSIRVHIHSQIEHIRLTPDPLTIRHGADGFQFTLLARFDDRVVLENNNGHLTPLSAEELPLFCLSFQQEVLVSLPRVGPGEPGSAAASSVRPSAW
jgi:hypothetical protein